MSDTILGQAGPIECLVSGRPAEVTIVAFVGGESSFLVEVFRGDVSDGDSVAVEEVHSLDDCWRMMQLLPKLKQLRAATLGVLASAVRREHPEILALCRVAEDFGVPVDEFIMMVWRVQAKYPPSLEGRYDTAAKISAVESLPVFDAATMEQGDIERIDEIIAPTVSGRRKPGVFGRLFHH